MLIYRSDLSFYIEVILVNIPDKVRNLFEKQDLVAFGTADKQGIPNVVPIFWKKILDKESVILIDNFMDMTKNNVLENKNVCVSFWDAETNEAYKMKGKAVYHTEGPVYDEGKEFIQSKDPKKDPKGMVEIKINEIYSLNPGSKAGEKINS